MRRLFFTCLSLFLVLFLRIELTAQTTLDGSFDSCYAQPASLATPSIIESYFAACHSTNSVFGGSNYLDAQVFYSDGNQGGTSGTSNCFFSSPTPSQGLRNIGFTTDVTVTVGLSAALTPGNCYKISFDGLNLEGSDGGGTCPDNTASAAFEVGVSNSSTSFGTVVGSSAPLAPSNSGNYTTIQILFTAPSGTNDRLTFQLKDPSFTNTVSNLFMDNVSIATATGCTPLPIKLVNFNTENSNCNVVLNWSLATDNNIDHFEVQRSIDGVNFKSISSIEAVNNAANKTYTYQDQNTENKLYFYRLLTFLKNGEKEYSDAVRQQACNTQKINIYPNPATDFLNSSGLAVGNNVQISDATGRVAVSKTVSKNTENINISQLPKGTYLVTVLDKQTGKKSVSKIVKQ